MQVAQWGIGRKMKGKVLNGLMYGAGKLVASRLTTNRFPVS